MMRDSYRFVLLLPFLIFGVGVWLYFQTENEVRVQMAQAQARWRVGDNEKAVALYESISERYPASRYADDALWEAGSIYYFNYYDVNRAISSFQLLVTRYPGTPLARESHLKIAEIDELALKDLNAAVEHWREALAVDPSIRSRRQIHFKMGDAYLKMGRFKEAKRQFQVVIGDGLEDHLSEQACVRTGAILQIVKDYRQSVEFFQQVLERSKCADCRLRAKLGLIESYEFMDDLPKAIATANSIQPSEYPEPLKKGVLKRLTDKNRYYGR